MSDKPMTPGQLAFVTHLRAMITAGYDETLTENDWDDMLESERGAWEASSEAVRQQMLELMGVDLVFLSEAAVVFESLAKDYPDQGPIEIVAAMLSERSALQAFKARAEAGLKP